MQTPSARGARRRDDRGFTLVELIVAIVILAIVFVPLLSAFVTGARTQAKSSQQNNATILAQNIVEIVQAASLDTLLTNAADFSPTGADAGFVTQVKDENGTLTGYAVESAVPTVTGKTANGKTTLTYPTRIVKLENQTSGASSYQALVTLTPDNNYSAENSVVSNSMDAVINMSGADTSALASINEICAETTITMDQMKSALARSITVTSTLEDGKYTINVVFVYTGTLSYSYNETIENDDGSETVVSHTRVVSFVSPDKENTKDGKYAVTETATATVQKPENSAALKAAGRADYSLYIRFAPWYPKSYSSGNVTEPINIYNYSQSGNDITANAFDFNVFLIDVSNTDVSKISAFYQPDIKYHNQIDLNYTRLFTNIDLSKSSWKTYSAIQPGKTTGTSKAIDGTLVEKQQVDRMYTVTVQVFKATDDLVSAKPLVTLTASKLR